MIKKNILLISLLVVVCGCRQMKEKKHSGVGKITVDMVLPTTPVKDQGHSSLCWIYAMLATIETDHIAEGDSVNLSADYVARQFLSEQAREAFFTHRRSADVTSLLQTRGMMTMTLDIIDTYGLTHFDAYHRKDGAEWNVTARKLSQATAAAHSIEGLEASVNRIMDKDIGFMPLSTFMYGVRYTPVEFTRSLALPGDYEALTSFTHHPYGERFALELPDNRYHQRFLNVPIDSLMAAINLSLSHRHAVCWEGDVSENGFCWADGIATLDDDDVAVTAESRQRAFINKQTTDDHCMEIIGRAHDSKGRRYYICKNSWGNSNRLHGFMYLSENYVRMKTIAIAFRD